jgi:hypothetical protein
LFQISFKEQAILAILLKLGKFVRFVAETGVDGMIEGGRINSYNGWSILPSFHY